MAAQNKGIVASIEDFDTKSGALVERAIFNHRLLVILLCALATAFLAYQALGIRLNASFEKAIPTNHPYVVNFLENRKELSGIGNSIRVAISTQKDSIFDKTYLDTLAKINDEIYLLSGVDKPFMKSLWTPSTRWLAVTEDGLDGDTVIPATYDGSPESLEQIRQNVARSGEIGQLVAGNFKSSVIYVPLLDINPQTGKPLDYGQFSRQLEDIRAKYQTDDIQIHITGFTKILGDLIEGLTQVMMFFVVAVVITLVILYWYTRCLRSTLVVVACSLVAVLWQLGLLATLNYDLDPYSILVPFLVFAIGISHGAQKMNGIMQDIGRGFHRVIAARNTFRRLFAAGLTALLSDAAGFAVLMVIEIPVIQDLAITASIGVAVLIITNLILLPVFLSYMGVSEKAATRSLAAERGEMSSQVKHPVWTFLDNFTRRSWAISAIVVASALAIFGVAVGQSLKIGDMDPGAPELRPDSRYNLDAAFMTQNYAASTDIFVVMIKTGEDQCTHYSALSAVDALAWKLEQLPGVESTNSMASFSKIATSGYNEGSYKWYELIPNDSALGTVQ
ncbi:MMPL family transporter, partial [Pseudomonas sp. CrR25]|nr:MMPL family transporter [Pseudomonas sp. CrR25]